MGVGGVGATERGVLLRVEFGGQWEEEGRMGGRTVGVRRVIWRKGECEGGGGWLVSGRRKGSGA
eukprot:3837228-Rhodomonas_salina.1